MAGNWVKGSMGFWFNLNLYHSIYVDGDNNVIALLVTGEEISFNEFETEKEAEVYLSNIMKTQEKIWD